MDKKVALCVVVALLGMATVTWGQGEVSYEASADVLSKYIWRGQDSSDDWVVQPQVSATYQGFTAGVWGNMDLTNDQDEDWEFTEYDYFVDYSAQATDMIGYSVGSIYYYFPGGTPTMEVYGGVNFDVIAKPSVTAYWDVDEAGGVYVVGAVEHSVTNFPDLPFGIDLGASLGWGDSGYNEFYWGSGVGSELNDLVLSASFPFEVGEVKVTPTIRYVALLGSDVKDSDAYNSDNNYLVVGANCVYDF